MLFQSVSVSQSSCFKSCCFSLFQSVSQVVLSRVVSVFRSVSQVVLSRVVSVCFSQSVRLSRAASVSSKSCFSQFLMKS